MIKLAWCSAGLLYVISSNIVLSCAILQYVKCPVFQQIDVLPEIARAVKGGAEVYLDGGVRSGTDVFKALALGAKVVFFGRPLIWGLVHSVSW